MSCKYVIVCGGVISGTGKGVAAASIALLLKLRGAKVNYIKFDPYLNIDCGLINPVSHGENFVLNDGHEVDLDLGHVERIAGISMSSSNIYTSGTICKELIIEQERGDYLGDTIQTEVHVVNKIKKRLSDVGKDHDVVIAEIGGTVGDSESNAFYEAARSFKQEHPSDVMFIMVAPILWVATIKEFKTKPFQNAVRELRRYGIQPDVLLCRSDRLVPPSVLEKMSKHTGVPQSCVLDAPDVDSIYQVPVKFYERNLDDLISDMLRLKRSACRISKYKELVECQPTRSINIGVIGKYDCDDAYISLREALYHAGASWSIKVNVSWIKAQALEKSSNILELVENLHGIIVPGGFDNRGIEGKIKAIQYARENKIPFLGICLGLQCAVIEFATNVVKMEDANSQEFDKDCKNPVVHFVKGQQDIVNKSASMRLGAYDCELTKGTLTYELYGKQMVSERHRHRLEVNKEFVADYSKYGLIVSGINPQSGLIEMMELTQEIHPFFIGTQAHPEFKSKLSEAAPLFKGLVQAAAKGA